VFEASNEAAIQTEEQVLAVAVEVVFGELIHCYKYIGTVIRGQRFLCVHEALRDSLPSRSHTALST
jgi:hypothetical protein